jgi:3,4-dihydroxy 2-butanone 4-phosphate synthase/GTP cyclohydrolase II
MHGIPLADDVPTVVGEVRSVPLPTRYGPFLAHAFGFASGNTHIALVMGATDSEPAPLTRLHSECLTGDVLTSVRCDCGIQLHAAMRDIWLHGRGILIYLAGHEGRGIGLIGKLRAYLEQDNGADTVDANRLLGYPVDARNYAEAAAVLHRLGVSRVRLMTNNLSKATGLTDHGILVEEVVPHATAGHLNNHHYLSTKQARLGHRAPAGIPLPAAHPPPVDITALIGPTRLHDGRPHVVLKYAQTLDGRIATSSGDSKWISGEQERRVAHALRAACDAVLVGVGTACTDDPQLTVRMVDGVSPTRVVLDSTLRTPADAKLFDGQAPTVVIARVGADPARARQLMERGVVVRTVPAAVDGVDLDAALCELDSLGIRNLLVEGGSRVITSLLRHHVVDRLIVSISPRVVGSGVSAVGDLGTNLISEGIALVSQQSFSAGDDLLLAADLVHAERTAPAV